MESELARIFPPAVILGIHFMRYLNLSAILYLTCPAVWAATTIEFTGLITTPEKSLFAVTSTASGGSMWMSVGQSFEGYEALGYDPHAQILSLKKGDETLRLQLKDAKIKQELIWVKPKAGEPSVGLVAQSRIELSITDNDGNVLYRGLLDPGEMRHVPRGGDLILATETPEKMRVEVDGKQWPLQNLKTKTFLKTVIISGPRK